MISVETIRLGLRSDTLFDFYSVGQTDFSEMTHSDASESSEPETKGSGKMSKEKK